MQEIIIEMAGIPVAEIVNIIIKNNQLKDNFDISCMDVKFYPKFSEFSFSDIVNNKIPFTIKIFSQGILNSEYSGCYFNDFPSVFNYDSVLHINTANIISEGIMEKSHHNN